ncbi:hypothetical protein SNA13_17070, partial [Escherichia coli]|nr:hypothetical protein [Escherichia coli]
CAAPSAKGDDKFITTDYLQQCPGNYQLESNPERHDKTPLAAAISNRSAREDRLRGLEVEA